MRTLNDMKSLFWIIALLGMLMAFSCLGQTPTRFVSHGTQRYHFYRGYKHQPYYHTYGYSYRPYCYSPYYIGGSVVGGHYYRGWWRDYQNFEGKLR
jgi:hypothetical protein